MSTDSLSGQVAVVTGAARGVGAELARTLAARGARVALVGLEPEELKATAAACGPDADWWQADVTDAEAMSAAAAEITQRYGRVDVVVANAGIAAGGLFQDSDMDTWRRVVEVNLLGSATTARAFLPALVASRGYLLQIASLAAMTPAPLMTAYCASKSGVEAFAHALRAEVANQGVRVGVGYLSWTDTDMVRGADEDEVMRDMRASLPWPTNRTYPLEPAVQRIADGIARRSVHVYAQGWLRGYQLMRGQIPLFLGRFAPIKLRGLEPRLRESAAARRGLVGRGGAADEAARAQRRVSG
ncbi:SDR family oxidoreductase [Streptacidiphilus sp. PB12-B1b]|uniref:SDR family oxidoreductase n=1 Tax=Streptacidiphilus sp. PB12-B1b TaxID=2705012 RepID=UPI0015FC04BF|nr:SDR family oxidoreductase [Streptacidiphilus sp. PB12-B1b]QMU76486.1 SDR family oxidoreductase [Streptacidiphilus sp. PB12-B1b]